MARPEKVAVVDELQQNLNDSAATLLTDYRGLSVAELAELRAELRKTGATYKVVKNTMTRRAAEAAGIAGLKDYLVGPTALVFCDDDPVGPAKALKAFAKDHPELLVKAGYLDGEILDDQATIKLADLESREELLARFAGLLDGALSNFVRLLQAPLTDMGRLMAALEDEGGAAPDDGSTAEAAGDAADTTEETADAADDSETSVTETVADAAADAADAAADAVETAADKVAEVVDEVTDAVSGDESDESDEAADDSDDDS